MNSADAKKVTEIALNKVKHLIPDFSKYELRKDFRELYYNNEEFVQVEFYDRTVIGNRYKNIIKEFNMSVDKKSQLADKIKKYNDELKKAQKLTFAENKNSIDEHTYFYFERVGSDLGICHLKMFERSKLKEDEKKRIKNEEHKERMREDRDYRKEVEWFEEKDRPFGGAYKSWEDYYKDKI
ncbi:MAG: hypothetical protein ACOCRK_03495 [bacterium]